MFAALSEKNWYFKDRVAIAVMLGPVTKMTNTKSQALVFVANYYTLHIDRYVDDYLTDIEEFCQKHVFYCQIIEKAFVPGDSDMNDEERLALAINHYPLGRPAKSLDHYF